MLICSLWGLYDKDKVHACSVGSDSATTWTVAHRAPLSMEFSRQEYWSGLPFPSPRDLPNPGIEPVSSATLALAGQFFTTAAPGPNPHLLVCFHSCSAFGITGFCPSGHSWLNLSPSFPVFFLYKILHWLLIFLKKYIYLFIYFAVLGLGCSMQILSCSMWDLVPWLGIEPGPPALGVHVTWSYSEVFRIGKSLKIESGLVVTWAGMMWAWGISANGYEISFWDSGDVLRWYYVQ